MWVGGYEQSGPLVEEVWKKALKALDFTPKNILILGLGCGSAAKVISKKFPTAKITGVEIDPVMIKIGKKYFGLGKIPNLKITCADALNFVKKTKQKFDLILVDVYVGGKQIYPDYLKLHKKKNGAILINKLENNKNTVLVF